MLEQLVKLTITTLAFTHAHYPIIVNLWLPVVLGLYVAVNCGPWRLRALGGAVAQNRSRLAVAVWRA